MKLNTFIPGLTTAELVIAINFNYNGFNNCALGAASIDDISAVQSGIDVVAILNSNVIELDTTYPITKDTILVGLTGQAFIDRLNNNFSRFTEKVNDESVALFTRMEFVRESQETPINDAIEAVFNESILDLKLVGAWYKSEAIYFLNLHNRRASLLNWVNNNDDAWFDSGISWKPKDGITGDGVKGKIDLLTLPAEFTKYVQDSAIIGYYSDTNDLTDGKAMMISGTYGSGNLGEIIIRTATFQVRMNCTTDSDSPNHGDDVRGLVVLERDASNNTDLYRDGIKTDLSSDASVGMPPISYKLLANAADSYSKNKISFAIIGSAFGTKTQAHLKDIVYNFNTKIKLVIPDDSIQGLYKTTKPMMTIRFDDGLADCYSKWFGVLNDYGVVGESVLLTSLMGMTWEQVKELEDAGWDIGGHGTDATDISTVTRAEALAIITECKEAIESHGIACNHFTPQAYGQGSLSARADIMKYYKSCHAGSLEEATFAGLNPQILEHSNFNAMRCDIGGDWQIDTPEGITAVKAQLDTAIAENRWAIIFLHGWTADKETGLRTIIEYAQLNDIDIVTLTKALDSCEII